MYTKIKIFLTLLFDYNMWSNILSYYYSPLYVIIYLNIKKNLFSVISKICYSY